MYYTQIESLSQPLEDCITSKFSPQVNLTLCNNNNKYKTYIAHIQYKYFHMRITDDRIKSKSQLKAICINKSVKKLS